MADNQSTHTSSPTEPPAPLDACPSCLSRNHAPITSEHPDPRTVVGHYLCVGCGETWETSYWTGASA